MSLDQSVALITVNHEYPQNVAHTWGLPLLVCQFSGRTPESIVHVHGSLKTGMMVNMCSFCRESVAELGTLRIHPKFS